MSWLWQRVCVCSLIFLLQIICTSPKNLTNITDKFGNVADQDSRLYFAKFSKPANYASKIRPLLDDGLLPFYKMSRLIARSSFGFAYPYDMAMALVKQDYVAALFTLAPGLGFNNVLGILTVVGYVITALTLPCKMCCCCRRREKPFPSFTKVVIRGGGVGILVVFTLAGLGATVQVTRHVAPTGAQFLEEGENALDDLVSFLNNSVEELFYIFDQLDFTKSVLFRDLDNMGTLVGAPVRDAVIQKTQIMNAARNLHRFAEVSAESNKTLQMMSVDLELLKDQIKALNNVTRNLPGGSAVSLPSPQVDLQDAQNDFNKMGNLDLPGAVDEATMKVDDIPQKVDNYSRDIVEDIKGNFNDSQKTLNGFKDAIQKMKDSALKGVGLDDKKKILNSSKEYIDQAQEKTNLSGLAMTGIQFLAVFLVLFGTLIVILAYRLNLSTLRATGNEDKRMIKTTHGSRIIFCGMFFFILFAWIFMLMSVILFVIGAAVEGLICQMVEDPDFKIIDTLTEEKNILGEHNGTWLAGKILSIPTSSATIGSVFRDCRDDKTLFKATDMTDHPSVNFTKIIDFKDKLNITALLNAVNIDVGNVDLLGGDVDQYLKEMDALQDHIPFAQLQNLSSEVNASAKMAELNATLAAPQRQTFSAEVNGNLQEIDKLTENIKQNATNLQDSLGDIKTQTNNSREYALASQSMIQTTCDEEKAKAIKTLADRLNMMTETFINESKRGVMEDYGKCGPLYTIFQVIMQNAVCGNLANIINGLWLGLGWSQLFLLATASVAVGMYRMLPAPFYGIEGRPTAGPKPTAPPKPTARPKPTAPPKPTARQKPTNPAIVAPVPVPDVGEEDDEQEDEQEEQQQNDNDMDEEEEDGDEIDSEDAEHKVGRSASTHIM